VRDFKRAVTKRQRNLSVAAESSPCNIVHAFSAVLKADNDQSVRNVIYAA